MLTVSRRWTTYVQACQLRARPCKIFGCPAHRTLASLTDAQQYQPGETLHGFTFKRTKYVPELQLTASSLEHEKTGAEYLHIARDDKNNVFSVGFKTNPPDDTGVPHILEHTTLCGSQKYPVRDPFFKMLPRSLSNFMNAFTSSDHTSYPFSTTNRQDFKNLLSVYLDATLNPLLNEDDFAQEGWRIGPENPVAVAQGQNTDVADQRLVFKGVVYNEMKGQMSDASYLYYIKFQDHIFPDIHNSGGDPQRMTDLTYESLKDFHLKHYHPSNAKLFTYGDIPLAHHLEEIDQQLSHFERKAPDSTIKIPKILKEPLCYAAKGPFDPLVDRDMQYKTSTSWIMGDSSNIIETFSLQIIASLLTDGYGSPFYRNLIEAGLGSDWSPNTGFDSAGKIGVFSIGLNGVRKFDVPRVKEVIHSTLREVHQRGFDKGKIDGILHQLELALKHKTANFGMGLMQRIQPGWFNGVDPFEALAWNDTINAFRALHAKEGYLEGLLEKYLLNDRTLTFTMDPDESYGQDLASEENARLTSKISDACKAAGGEAKVREELTARELKLLEAQQGANSQNLSCLPSVHVEDIPRQMERKAVRDSSIEDVKVHDRFVARGEQPEVLDTYVDGGATCITGLSPYQLLGRACADFEHYYRWREANTNGLTYFRAISTLVHLPVELRMLIPLFNESIMRLGTRNQTMGELEDLIKLKTGGITTSYHASPSPFDMKSYTEGLSFSGYALDSNIPVMYELLRTLIQETNFDGPEAESKIRQLLQSDTSGALDGVASSGHSYAMKAAQAGLTDFGLLNEQTGGLMQVRKTADLASRSPVEGLSDIVNALKTIQQHAISNTSGLRVALTCDQEAVLPNEVALQKFLSRVNIPTSMPLDSNAMAQHTQSQKTFFTLPYQVYYSALALPTVSYNHPSGAPLQVLSQLLTHKHLHHEIREKGGAYGGGAYSRDLSGVFGFYSYRDPNPQTSLKIMHDAGRWARDRDWTDQDLEEAKLSIFQNVDAPESVSQEGMARFLNGIDSDLEQTKREQMLDVKKEDLQGVAQAFLVDGANHARTVVLGEKNDWVKEEEGWTFKNLELGKPSEFAGASDLGAGDLA